jgi:predicted phage tail protein
MIPPQIIKGKSSIELNSPNYAFDGVTTTQIVGAYVPIILGQHKASGNIINQYIYNSDFNNYLNVLLAVCEGEIDSFSEHKVNDILISTLTGATVTEKLGTNSQTVIPNFNDQHNVYNINSEIANGATYSYTTTDSDVEAFELNFNLPNGLYIINNDTWNRSQFVVEISFRYSVKGAGVWVADTLSKWKNSDNYNRLKIRVEGLTPAQYDIEITKVTRTDDPAGYGANAIRESTLYITSIDEIKTADIQYVNTTLLGYKLLSVENLTGGTPNFTSIVKGLKVLIPDVKYGGVSIAWDLYYWDGTSKFKRLSDNADCTWDGTTYITAWTANPIWLIKALILSTRFGLGDDFTSSKIDDASFLAMAKYCDEKLDNGAGGYEKRFMLDVVLDSPQTPTDLLIQLLATCRSHYYYSEGKLKINIYRAGSPVALFGMGSIEKGSFNQKWSQISETPNVVDVTYNDKTKDYQEETIDYLDSEYDGTAPIRRQSLRLFVTRTSQAIREARYYLKLLKYSKRKIQFRTSINASHLEPGDIIAVSHDLPQWGFSGRVQATSTTTLLKLDRSITIQPATTYKVTVYFKNTDTLETVTVTSAAGTYTQIAITALSKAPAIYDEYAFGVENINYKTFRITKIDEENTNEITINAIEYNSLIYDDSAVILPSNYFTTLSNSIPDVSDLTLAESIAKTKDGNIENLINVYFQVPIMEDYFLKKYVKAKIYVKEASGDYVLRGEAPYPQQSFQILGGLNTLVDYTVAVVSVDDKGQEKDLTTAPNETITVLGLTAKPANVTGFDVSQESSLLKFTWNPNTEVDLSRYVIRKGSEWITGQNIAELVDSTSFISPVSEIGTQTYMIKAVDTSGNESLLPVFDTIIVTTPPDMNFMNTINLFSFNLEYKLNNLSMEMRNDFNIGYDRKVLSITSAETWEEWEAGGGTWEADEANIFCELDAGAFEASGYFEMVDEYYDNEAIFPFKIISDPDYKNLADGTVTLQMKYSDDNITWTSFADINPNIFYRTRYLKFKIILATTSSNVYLYDYKVYINAPMLVTDWGSDIAIDIAGTTISFKSDFTTPPRVTVNIVNGILGVVKISSKTATEMVVRCYDLAGSAIGTCEIDFDAKGY